MRRMNTAATAATVAATTAATAATTAASKIKLLWSTQALRTKAEELRASIITLEAQASQFHTVGSRLGEVMEEHGDEESALRAFDRNGDGRVSRNEFRLAARDNHLSTAVSNAAVDELFESLAISNEEEVSAAGRDTRTHKP